MSPKRKPGRPKKVHPGGRPTKYKAEYPNIVFEYLSQTGAGKAKIAKLLKVSRETVYDWMRENKKFSDSMAKGLDEYNNLAIKKALIKRAVGFRYTETTKESKDGKTLQVTKTIRKMVIPDVSAIKHWQVNRDSENWADKKEFDGKLTIEDAINAITDE